MERKREEEDKKNKVEEKGWVQGKKADKRKNWEVSLEKKVNKEDVKL